MWNRRVVNLMCFISLYKVVHSFSVIPLDVHPSELNLDRNVSNIDIMGLIDKAKGLIETSSEDAREQMIKELEKLEPSRHDKRADAKQETKEVKRLKMENKNVPKKRFKRQMSKFAEAARMNNLKAFRIYLTMFKNLLSKTTVGGTHPMHPDVPKPVVYLFKQRVLDFFFPPIGDEGKKQ